MHNNKLSIQRILLGKNCLTLFLLNVCQIFMTMKSDFHKYKMPENVSLLLYVRSILKMFILSGIFLKYHSKNPENG